VLDDRIVMGTGRRPRRVHLARRTKRLWSYEQIENRAMAYSSPAVSDAIVVVGAATGKCTRSI
jgi:hypothetical protein